VERAPGRSWRSDAEPGPPGTRAGVSLQHRDPGARSRSRGWLPPIRATTAARGQGQHGRQTPPTACPEPPLALLPLCPRRYTRAEGAASTRDVLAGPLGNCEQPSLTGRAGQDAGFDQMTSPCPPTVWPQEYTSALPGKVQLRRTLLWPRVKATFLSSRTSRHQEHDVLNKVLGCGAAYRRVRRTSTARCPRGALRSANTPTWTRARGSCPEVTQLQVEPRPALPGSGQRAAISRRAGHHPSWPGPRGEPPNDAPQSDPAVKPPASEREPVPARAATWALHAAGGHAGTARTPLPTPFLPRRHGRPAGTPSRGSRPPPSFAQPRGYVRLTVSFPGKTRRKTWGNRCWRSGATHTRLGTPLQLWERLSGPAARFSSSTNSPGAGGLSGSEPQPLRRGRRGTAGRDPRPGIAPTQLRSPHFPLPAWHLRGRGSGRSGRTAWIRAPSLAPAAGKPFIPTSIGAGAPVPGSLCAGAACDAGSPGRASAASSAPPVPRRSQGRRGRSRAVQRRFARTPSTDLLDAPRASGCRLGQTLSSKPGLCHQG